MVEVKTTVVEDEVSEEAEYDDDNDELATAHRKPKFVPVAFHDACIRRIEKVLGTSLLKRSRATFIAPDKNLKLICAISREHARSRTHSYWFAFHPHQAEYLAGSGSSYVAWMRFGESVTSHQIQRIRTLDGRNERDHDERSNIQARQHFSYCRSFRTGSSPRLPTNRSYSISSERLIPKRVI